MGLDAGSTLIQDPQDGSQADVVDLSDSTKRLATAAKIQGGTDNTKIGNTGDRLKVITQDDVLDPQKVLYTSEHLETSGGSKEMNVNGSVTPVKFYIAPPSGTILIVERISLFMQADGTMTGTNFGNRAALTSSQGLEILIKSNGASAHQIMRFFDNDELCNELVETTFSPFSASGFLGSLDVYRGVITFKHPQVLNGTLGDEIYAMVNDDLTGLNRLLISVLHYKDNA